MNDDQARQVYEAFYKFEIPKFDPRTVRSEKEPIQTEDLSSSLRELDQALSTNVEDRDRDIEIDLALSSVADLVLSALAGRAARGKKSASSLFHKSVRNALKDHTVLVKRENPEILHPIRQEAEMPGWVSNHKPIMEKSMLLAKRARQGESFPFPQNEGGSTGKLQGVHALVHDLFCLINSERRHLDLGPWDREYLAPFFHPLQARISDLAPLTLGNVRAWRSLAWDILSEATSGEPKQHPAFERVSGEKARDSFNLSFASKARSLDDLRERGETHPWL